MGKIKRRNKIFAPIIITVLFLALIGGTLAFWFWVQSVSSIPICIVIVFSLIYVLPIIGIIIALIQRLKEIKGGEEDEASKY